MKYLGGGGFAPKARDRLSRQPPTAAQDFEGDLALERDLPLFIDNAHAAAAQFTEHFKVAEFVELGWICASFQEARILQAILSCEEDRKSRDFSHMIGRSEIEKLSPDEKLQLLQAVWDSFVINPESLPVSEEEKKELRRRSLAHRSRPESSLSERDFRRRLDERLGSKR